jgi:tetratricopeptide (TPR) repeat protein
VTAKKDFEQVVERVPTHVYARLRVVEASLQGGEVADLLTAGEHLRIVLATDPTSAEARTYLARLHILQEDYAAARRVLDEVLHDHPAYAPALLERMLVARGDGAYEQAAQHSRRLLALDPHQRTALYFLWMDAARTGEPSAESLLQRFRDQEKAAQRLDWLKMQMTGHAVCDNRFDPALRHEAGVITLRLGRRQEALAWFERALIENPNHKATHQALADYYERGGQPAVARRHRLLAGEL